MRIHFREKISVSGRNPYDVTRYTHTVLGYTLQLLEVCHSVKHFKHVENLTKAFLRRLKLRASRNAGCALIISVSLITSSGLEGLAEVSIPFQKFYMKQRQMPDLNILSACCNYVLKITTDSLALWLLM